METKRLNYLILLYVMIFILSAIFISCEDKNKDRESEPEEETYEAVVDSVFILESIEPISEEVDSLYEYGFPFEAQKVNDSTYVFQGDILIAPGQKVEILEPGAEIPRRPFQGVARTTGLWPENTVYYTMDANLHAYARTDVANAIKWFHENTNLKFVNQAHAGGYIFFINGAGCSSYIGKLGNKQGVTLGATRCGLGSTIHEILHAVGFWHEQSRADRNQYVKVLYENIVAGREHNFKMVTDYNLPSANMTDKLDFPSIMLYSSYSFSSNGKPTMVKLDGSTFSANRVSPSAGDIASINKLYPALNVTPPPTEPEVPPVPIYENGKYYTLEGITVFRADNKWYYLTNYGWKEVQLVTNASGVKAWEFTNGEIPDSLKYENGKTYILHGLTVQRKDDKWWYYSRNCRCWKEVVMRPRTDGTMAWYYK